MISFFNLFLFVFSFVAIWFGAGLIIKSIDHIAHKLRLSSFAIAFFVLGLLTSIPETAVSINAVIDNSPEIFVGTLLGGTAVIFLFIIPILAILGRGVRLNHDLDQKSLLGLLAVIAAPGLVIIDHQVTNFEGLLLIFLYLATFYLVHRRHGRLEKHDLAPLSTKSFSFADLAQVGLGIAIVLISSQFIVNQTMELAKVFNISAFYISLIVLSLGTNLPELSLAVRAVFSGKKDIAFGDYLGSAAANTLLFGVFTLASQGEVFTFNSFFAIFFFTVVGLGLFYYFSKSQKNISRNEGLILFAIYLAFVVYEVGKGFSTIR